MERPVKLCFRKIEESFGLSLEYWTLKSEDDKKLSVLLVEITFLTRFRTIPEWISFLKSFSKSDFKMSRKKKAPCFVTGLGKEEQYDRTISLPKKR